MQDQLDLFRDLQKKLSKSWIAKYFIDYTDTLEHLKSQLDQRKKMGELDPDPLSFSTPNFVQIYASPVFNREDLLEFGLLSTNISPHPRSNSATSIWTAQMTHFQNFLDDVSFTLFKRPVNMEVICTYDGEDVNHHHFR